jgi:hypothetical protein
VNEILIVAVLRRKQNEEFILDNTTGCIPSRVQGKFLFIQEMYFYHYRMLVLPLCIVARLLTGPAILGAGKINFSLLHSIKIGSEAHPASCPINIDTKEAVA